MALGPLTRPGMPHLLARIAGVGQMDSSTSFLIFVATFPVWWQIPRVFWPVRMDSGGTRFTGLYRRYSVRTFTGYASDIGSRTDKLTVGSVSAHTTVTGGVASTTVSDNRTTMKRLHTEFFLTDATGATQSVDAVNVGPSIGAGHLVSAAWMVHNGKVGNAFLVFNHTTNRVYVEKTQRGSRNADRGLAKMLIPLPTIYVVLMVLAIVTFPLLALYGLAAMWHMRAFRTRGSRPLVNRLHQTAAGMTPANQPASIVVPNQSPPQETIDLVSQVKEMKALHDSGALTAAEYDAAKAKLLEL